METGSVASASVEDEQLPDPIPPYGDHEDHEEDDFTLVSGSTKGSGGGAGGVAKSVGSSIVSNANRFQKKIFFSDVSNHIKVGIIGTTNIGKSSLFNLMCRSEKTYAYVADALFSTIDAYACLYAPYDHRFEYLRSCFPLAKAILPAMVTVVDTAGIVQGSFKEDNGVGADSLESIRQVDVIVHMIKCFETTKLARYEPVFDPLRDLRMVEQELMLMDLYRIEDLVFEIESILEDCAAAEYLQFQYDLLLRLWAFVAGEARPIPAKRYKSKPYKYRTKMPKECKGKLIRLGTWELREREAIATYDLLTTKEIVYLANMTALDYNRHAKLFPVESIRQYLAERNDPSIISPISIELEQRLFDVEMEGQLKEYNALNSTHQSGVITLLRDIYETLRVIHFYTISEEEVKCWVLRRGSTVVDAAARKDINIARNLIRAERITFEDYFAYEADKLKLSMDGKVHGEGRKYLVNDGDILEFLHHPFQVKYDF